MDFTASKDAKAGQLFKGTNTSVLDWKKKRQRQQSGCDEPGLLPYLSKCDIQTHFYSPCGWQFPHPMSTNLSC